MSAGSYALPWSVSGPADRGTCVRIGTRDRTVLQITVWESLEEALELAHILTAIINARAACENCGAPVEKDVCALCLSRAPELHPCFACGSETLSIEPPAISSSVDDIARSPKRGEVARCVLCTACGARGPIAMGEARFARTYAITAWNELPRRSE